MYYYNVFHSQFLQHTLKTALHEAVFYESRDIVEILLYFGAEPTLKDKVYSFVLFALFQALERTGFLVLFCFVMFCFSFFKLLSEYCHFHTCKIMLKSIYFYICILFSRTCVLVCTRTCVTLGVGIRPSVCVCLRVFTGLHVYVSSRNFFILELHQL